MTPLAALKLQLDWGIDETLADTPIDRTTPPPIAAQPPARAPTTAAPTPTRQTPAARAQIAAAAVNTIEALHQTLAAFTDFPLATTATNLAFADGNPNAGLVVIGEAPGAEEDLAGRPLVGPAGQFLDRMLASVGLTRDHLLVTNLIPWRPPGGRPPTDTEVQTCLPFLLRHLTLLRPRLVVTLGLLPTRALTGRDETIRKLRGRRLDLTIPGLPAPIGLLPMLHPAYVMRTPGAKKDAWTDLITLRKSINSL